MPDDVLSDGWVLEAAASVNGARREADGKLVELDMDHNGIYVSIEALQPGGNTTRLWAYVPMEVLDALAQNSGRATMTRDKVG